MHNYSKEPIEQSESNISQGPLAILISLYLLLFVVLEPSRLTDLGFFVGFLSCSYLYFSPLLYAKTKALQAYPALRIFLQISLVAGGGFLLHFLYFANEFIDFSNFSLNLPIKISIGLTMSYMLFNLLKTIRGNSCKASKTDIPPGVGGK